MRRVVVPEILDELAADDPAAVRSRRDLAMINALMGNERWVCRAVAENPAAASRGIVEIGAGTGRLISRLARRFPEAPVAAIDLVGPPPRIDPRIRWHQGDVFAELGTLTAGVLVANLFLHHFEADALGRLAGLLDRFALLVVCEPRRSRAALAASLPLLPLVNRVTRHDMPVSIRAGFRSGELAKLLMLDPLCWNVSESCTWRGAQRMVACRA
jgi:hypothetical protein